MDNAEKRQDAAGDKGADRGARAPVDHGRDKRRPDHGRYDEAVAQGHDHAELGHAMVGGREQLRESIRRHVGGVAELDREHPRDRWEEAEHDRRGMPLRGRLERLCRDLDRDEDEDGGEHRQRNQLDEV